MATHRSKPREIEAWQVVAPLPIEQTGAFPQWLIAAIADGIIVFTDENTGDGTILNETHGSEINFKDTDWIIFNGPEDIYPCTDEEFQQRYERIE